MESRSVLGDTFLHFLVRALGTPILISLGLSKKAPAIVGGNVNTEKKHVPGDSCASPCGQVS